MITNETVRDVREKGEIVIPRGTRVEVNDTRLPSRAKHNRRWYSVALADMSSMEIQIDGVYIPGCGPQDEA